MAVPKHFQKKDSTPQVRGRKQESKIAKALKGRVAVNSGATFGENDIITDYCEVEAKLTTQKSFSLSAEYIQKVRDKCSLKKIPLMVVNFENYGKEYAILPMEDFEFLLQLVQEAKSETEK